MPHTPQRPSHRDHCDDDEIEATIGEVVDGQPEELGQLAGRRCPEDRARGDDDG
jgi:hypothetical protein